MYKTIRLSCRVRRSRNKEKFVVAKNTVINYDYYTYIET